MSFTRYSLDKKVFIICSYVETKSLRAVSRKFKAEYNKTLHEKYVWRIVKKFKTYGTVNNLPNQRKSKVFEDTELMEKAKHQILATTSLRNSARELGLSLYTTFLIRDLFAQNIVGKFFNFNWPPRSPDLSPLDFFLWGYLKNKVYSGVKATTLAGLKLRIQEAFEETRLETMSLIKTYDNALYRMKLVSENGGKHIEISVKYR